MFTTGETVGLTEWIIDDTFLVTIRLALTFLCICPKLMKLINNLKFRKNRFSLKICFVSLGFKNMLSSAVTMGRSSGSISNFLKLSFLEIMLTLAQVQAPEFSASVVGTNLVA